MAQGAEPRAEDRAIAILGDLQRTSWFERRLLGREQNDAARERLIASVVEARPQALILLGDLVGFGCLASEWRRFDRLFAPVRAAGIPVWPILGNHDIWGWPALGLRHHHLRFPRFAERSWYRERLGGLLLVFFDSNVKRLGGSRWREQQRWLEDVLADAQRDRSLRGVLAFTHHPPFTNARQVGESASVQEAFLPAFFASERTLALISGHVHAYEHFIERGKHFIVQGSGGGPRVILAEGEARRHVDHYEGPSPRPFCFSLLRETERGAQLEVKGFQEATTPLRTLEVIELAREVFRP